MEVVGKGTRTEEGRTRIEEDRTRKAGTGGIGGVGTEREELPIYQRRAEPPSQGEKFSHWQRSNLAHA